jgi:hypothetical protein
VRLRSPDASASVVHRFEVPAGAAWLIAPGALLACSGEVVVASRESPDDCAVVRADPGGGGGVVWIASRGQPELVRVASGEPFCAGEGAMLAEELCTTSAETGEARVGPFSAFLQQPQAQQPQAQRQAPALAHAQAQAQADEDGDEQEDAPKVLLLPPPHSQETTTTTTTQTQSQPTSQYRKKHKKK